MSNMFVKTLVLLAVIFIAAGIYSGMPETSTDVSGKAAEWFDLMVEHKMITVAIIGGALLALMVFRSGKSSGTSGVGHFVQTVTGSAALLFVFGIMAIVLFVVMIIVAGIADALTGGKVQQTIDTTVAVARNEPLPERPFTGEACDFEDKLDERRSRLPTQWIAATICKDDGQFLVFTPRGTVPEIDYRNRNDRVLTSRPVSDFVQVESMYGKPGGMPDLYRLYIPAGQNGFEEASLDSVTFEIRARY